MDTEVIIIDIDGTLLNDENIILYDTKKIIMELQNSGIKIILASGRPTNGMLKYARELKIDRFGGLIVSNNGSRVVNPATDEVYFDKKLPKDLSDQILKRLEKFDLNTFIDNDNYLFVKDVHDGVIDIYGKPFDIIRSEKEDNDLKLCELDHLYEYEGKLNKILVAGNPEYLKSNYDAIIEPFKEKVNVEHSEDYLLEISSKNINKAVGLETALKKLGIDRKKSIAFGDGENDISILDYAETGVAMENANSKVKSHADVITSSNNEDGIYEFLKKINFNL